MNVSRNVSNVRKEWPTLAIWWKQLILNSNQIHFKNEYLGKPSWACLSHRSLEDGTRVQQIIIGYFVAPISEWMNEYRLNEWWVNEEWRKSDLTMNW